MAGYGVGLTKTNNASLRRPVTTCGTVPACIRQTHPDSWANDRPARPPDDRSLERWRHISLMASQTSSNSTVWSRGFLDWHTINHQSFAPFLWGFYRCDRWSLLIMGQLYKNKKHFHGVTQCSQDKYSHFHKQILQLYISRCWHSLQIY